MNINQCLYCRIKKSDCKFLLLKENNDIDSKSIFLILSFSKTIYVRFFYESFPTLFD